MFDKLKLKSKGSSVVAASPAATPGKPPTKKQIFQSRQNFGVNVGACFVLEKWIFHQLFPEDCGCELEVVQKLTKDKGASETAKIFEDYWTNFLSNDDWNWLKDKNVTSVRIPLGYWDIGGGKFTKGTMFEKYSSVYENAWKIFKKDFVEKALQYDISVLVDIHGLPFGANGADHSGETSCSNTSFWNAEEAQLLACNMLKYIANDLKDYENIAGLQIVNEADFSNDAKKQSRYYSAAINSIRESDKDVPIIISDGWWPDQWAKWIQEKQSDGILGVVIDHHCYRCFSDSDKNKAPSHIIKDLDVDLLTNITENGKGVDFMVGEYSCVIDESSWSKDDANSRRDELVVEYGKHQISLVSKRASFGSYFWTFKFQSGNGGEWDFKTMYEKGAIRPSLTVNEKQLPDKSYFTSKLDDVFNAHVNYWHDQNPKETYEHERFKEGFTTAWADATEFARFNRSVIGRIEAWKSARLQEHIKAKGSSRFLWEWVQGFDSGIQEFKNYFL